MIDVHNKMIIHHAKLQSSFLYFCILDKLILSRIIEQSTLSTDTPFDVGVWTGKSYLESTKQELP